MSRRMHQIELRALEVNDNLNCVTFFMPDIEAQLKGLLEKEEKGPLYGIPISIKEHVGYQGHPSTCGLVQYLEEVEEEDRVLVKVFKKQGAIVFAKTNVPQTLLCCETSNPIYGHTLNPHNRAKGVSGSSGGEGALIGGGGSILSIGSDLAGSIHLPSSVCGIAGFKPTSSRQSLRGVRACIDGMTAVSLCTGPMARDVDALVLSMRALWCDEFFCLDPNLPPLHFNEEIYSCTKPLRIGYYEEDGYFQANPGMRRVLLETKHLLEDAGHKLILFRPPRVGYAYELLWKAVLGDKGKTVADKFCETSNPIYGHTLNPHNRAKGVSGSSGGEGALIGGGGSILSIGSDLAGSIHLPSSVCGIAGFKPTSSRQSLRGVRACIDGMTAVSLCTGPMARDVDALVLSMRALWCDEFFCLDPNLPPLHFNEEIYSCTKPLRIGYYEEDGYFQANPGMRRVLLETKHLLEDAGHKLILFRPPRVGYAYELLWKAVLGDKGKTVADKFKNNFIDPNLGECAQLCKMPDVVKRILGFIFRPIYPRISRFLNSSVGARSVKHLWEEQIAVQEYQTEFLTEWRKLNLDVVLCPMLGPAFNIGYPGRLYAHIACTMLYNVLNYPAGVVPVGSVTAEDEKELKNYKGYCNDPWDKLYKKAVEGGVGLPLSVQCVALTHQDELCLRLMKEVETLSGHHQKRR